MEINQSWAMIMQVARRILLNQTVVASSDHIKPHRVMDNLPNKYSLFRLSKMDTKQLPYLHVYLSRDLMRRFNLTA